MKNKVNGRLARLIARADAGDVRAMLEYCSLFGDRERACAGREVRQRILRYLRAGARKGDADLLCCLGAEYYGGGLVKRDFARALHYYELSAAKGCVQAISNLGYCHYYGRSIPVDYRKAFECFLKAYMLGGRFLPEACYKLGDCFRHGRGVTADPLIARRLYTEAYEQAWQPTVSTFRTIEMGWDRRLLGADAAARLGDCFRLGIGGGIDLKQAARYYRIAAAGFRRKVEFGDCFAPPLLDSAKTHLREVRDLLAGKRPRRRRKFSLTIDAAGLQYVEGWEGVFAGISSGDEVCLLRDPGNAHDANAIAVMTRDGVRFGWIPRAFNELPASLLDHGVALDAHVVDKGEMDGRPFVTVKVVERKGE